MRQVLASLVVSVLALSACSGGDDEPEALTGTEAQQAADRAMLMADDLGEGWEETGTSPPDDEEGTDLDDCLSDEVAAASDEPAAESDTHEFARGDEPTNQQQLQISSIVFEDADLAAAFVDELATDDVRSCLSETFQEEVGADAETDGVEVVLGDFEAEEGFADAGDGATRLTAPVELSAEGLTLPATVELVVVHTGQVASALVAFALGDAIPDDELEAWTTAIAEKQARD